MKIKMLSFVLALLFCMSTIAHAEDTSPLPPESVVSVAQEDNVQEMSAEDKDAPALKDVRIVNEDGQHRIIKTWEASPDYDPEKLIEADFQKNGYTYKKNYVLMVSENRQKRSKLASETVTIAHEQKDGAIARLAPLLDYDREGYKGQLTLDVESIYTEAAGKQSYSYSITDTREYTGLERNDTYGIPKTVTKNGATLQLQDVDWTAMGDGGYRALASYAGSATGTNVAGYVSTATYLGEVNQETLESITYAVVYEGTPIPLPPPDYLPYVIAGAIASLCAIGILALWPKRRNTKIFALLEGQYRVMQRIRVSYIDPIIDLTTPSLGGISRDYLIVVDRYAAKRLNNQFIRVICADGTVKEYRLINNGYGCKIKVSAVSPTENEEE